MLLIIIFALTREDQLFSDLFQLISKPKAQEARKNRCISEGKCILVDMRVCVLRYPTRNQHPIRCMGCQIKARIKADFRRSDLFLVSQAASTITDPSAHTWPVTHTPPALHRDGGMRHWDTPVLRLPPPLSRYHGKGWRGGTKRQLTASCRPPNLPSIGSRHIRPPCIIANHPQGRTSWL